LGSYTTASFVEHVGTHWFNLKLQGYEAMLRGNPEIEEILRILKIKHLSLLQEVTPEQKLLGIMNSLIEQCRSTVAEQQPTNASLLMYSFLCLSLTMTLHREQTGIAWLIKGISRRELMLK